ncbi:response regulator [Pseudoduganella namucuonensis]|uniref:Response regulator receiver domain-containing protein n=1 Tax=Pseudoduganella namucuonensis TaxID=1035707 RepID=A0A1I7LZZ2_9BURK|nr:response regulator [Pseudoduganella namucuonensis]SFV15167.1 Response regulator receiver domain-containing protein [Pseudoduganella namucuonensis]
MNTNAGREGQLVLVVDDEFDVLSIYTMLLEYHGFRVRTAGNGREALAAAALERPDIVVSDFMMPVMDGGELCLEWRATPGLRGIPFILCSAGIMRKDLEIPYDSFFKKPVFMQQLVDEIKRLLAAPR